MNNIMFRIFLPFLMLAAFIPAAAKTTVKVQMDSSQILMGNQTALIIDIVAPENAPIEVGIDKNQLPKEIEIAGWAEGDTTSLGNGMVEMRRALILQSFDSGAYTLPPVLVVNGPDTVRSNQLALKVVPVDVSHLEDIHPIAGAMEYESRWWDFFPDWLTDYWMWMLAAIVIIIGGICAYLILTKKVNVNIMPQKRRLPPDEIAINRLNALRQDGLWERGQEKEYYTRLTDILRDYLAERFGINAMEMTSTQIIRSLNNNEETRQSNEHMKKILEVADFVKFARVRPLPDDNVQAFNRAMKFVEETRPAPEPEQPENGEPPLPQAPGTTSAPLKKEN